MIDISVIIPAHNRPRLLVEAVVSCLIQTRKNLEVLVIDDGSDAELAPALEQARQYLTEGAALRLIRQPKSGAPSARNRGFQESKGEFIQFLDSDDLLHPEKLQKQTAILERDPSLDMVFCLDEWFSETIGDMGVLWNAPNDEDEVDRFSRNDVVWNSGSPLWRREAVGRIGPWDARLACWQDWEFHVRALARGIHHAHLPEVLQFIRDHREPRISESLNAVVRENSKLTAYRLAGQHLKSKGLLNRDRGDGLAMYLIRVAQELARLNELKPARTALWTAICYAGSPGIKITAVATLSASHVAQACHKNQVSALNRARWLVERHITLPVRESRWKSIKTTRTEEPTALNDALEAVRAQQSADSVVSLPVALTS